MKGQSFAGWERARQVRALLASGMTQKQVAERLGVGVAVVNGINRNATYPDPTWTPRNNRKNRPTAERVLRARAEIRAGERSAHRLAQRYDVSWTTAKRWIREVDGRRRQDRDRPTEAGTAPICSCGTALIFETDHIGELYETCPVCETSEPTRREA